MSALTYNRPADKGLYMNKPQKTDLEPITIYAPNGTDDTVYLTSMNDQPNIGDITIDIASVYGHDDVIQISDIDLGDIGGGGGYPWMYDDYGNSQDNIRLTGGGEEMIRIEKDGFYVRGEKVPQDEKEAKRVYEAFKQWLTWSIIDRDDQ